MSIKSLTERVLTEPDGANLAEALGLVGSWGHDTHRTNHHGRPVPTYRPPVTETPTSSAPFTREDPWRHYRKDSGLRAVRLG